MFELKSYPPIPMTIGTVGVAMGVINAVQQADATSIRGPVLSTPMLLHARIAMGANTAITVRFCITCVRKNGIR